MLSLELLAAPYGHVLRMLRTSIDMLRMGPGKGDTPGGAHASVAAPQAP
jgi:hypothetical protein